MARFDLMMEVRLRRSIVKLGIDFENLRYVRGAYRRFNSKLRSYELERRADAFQGAWAKYSIAVPTKQTFDALNQ